MRVSYEELSKAGSDAIRATNSAFGRADDALEGIVWTECVLGHGYDLLRLADRMKPNGEWPAASEATQPGSAIVELPGCPAYGFAARLADLAESMAADPAGGGFGSVEAYGAFGGWIAPYVAFRLARNQHHAAVLWRPSSVPREGEAPATLVLAAAAAAQQDVPPILIAPGSAYGGTDRDKLLVGQIPTHLIDPLRAAVGRRPDSSLLAVVAIPSTLDNDLEYFESVGNAICSFSLASRAPELLDVTGKVRQAMESGTEVMSGSSTRS